LLNSKHILDQEGEFSAGDMAKELDPARYPPERQSYVVDMMQEPEVGLCFRLPGQVAPRWLMPECLPTNEPDVARFFEGALRFRFRYDFLPTGFVPRFIVEAYNKFTDRPTRWRTGALLEVDGCNVLVRADVDKRRIDLAVTGPQARRRSALAAVRHNLEVVHKLNPEIGTEARVPLPDDAEVDVGFEHLRALEAEEGATHAFRPEKAKRKYTVGELLEGVVGPRPEPVGPPLLTEQPWFPFACGGCAALALLILFVLPINESRFYVGAVLAFGGATTLLTMQYAPGRFYRRWLGKVLVAGFAIHAAASSAEAGFWGETAARLHWDGRVSSIFTIVWGLIAAALLIADILQQRGLIKQK
jgi:hypothetical protein